MSAEYIACHHEGTTPGLPAEVQLGGAAIAISSLRLPGVEPGQGRLEGRSVSEPPEADILLARLRHLAFRSR